MTSKVRIECVPESPGTPPREIWSGVLPTLPMPQETVRIGQRVFQVLARGFELGDTECDYGLLVKQVAGPPLLALVSEVGAKSMGLKL